MEKEGKQETKTEAATQRHRRIHRETKADVNIHRDTNIIRHARTKDKDTDTDTDTDTDRDIDRKKEIHKERYRDTNKERQRYS